MATSRRRGPPLTHEILADDHLLWTALRQILDRTPGYRRLTAAVEGAQDELHAATDDGQWALFVAAQEASNKRIVLGTLAALRWAFACGVEHGRGGGRSK
jgi:hypothetical protein